MMHTQRDVSLRLTSSFNFYGCGEVKSKCWMCQKGLAHRAAARVDVVRSLTCLQVAGCLCSGGPA